MFRAININVMYLNELLCFVFIGSLFLLEFVLDKFDQQMSLLAQIVSQHFCMKCY